MPYSKRNEITHLLRLSAPIVAAQVSSTLMGFIDAVMAGQVSATDLAAVAVANSIWFPALLLVMGILMALPPIISHHIGANTPDRVRSEMHQAWWLALVCSIGSMLLIQFAPLILNSMTVEPELNRLVIEYLEAVIWGAPGFAVYLVLRNTSEGLSFTKPSMWIGFLGLAVNIPLNYIFIYGELGAPAMGGAGCGVATAISMWLMGIGMFICVRVHPFFRPFNLLKKLEWPNFKAMWTLFRLGFPMALAFFFEVSIFSVVAVLLAPLGAVVVAGHQVALNFSSIIFMLPMSLGMAISIRMGYRLGQKDGKGCFFSYKTGLTIGLILACITALFTLLLRESIASIYSNNPEVVALASTLLMIATLYQFSDTVQVIGVSALRAFQDSSGIFIITLVSYWMMGFPVGLILGLTDWITAPMGPQGFWIGFIVGLTAAAIMLSLRLYRWKIKLKHDGLWV
ncbi:MATE family efflux transporter [Echinimonas agarilytica]|uniref:Multidrug-efflux transporter n=1 Tax=Echinimonas agarilytica TaxID=1215918 RepID=A0AA42B754_9GAMM|nr:MATE family efflux transporter [Echinimonas agarilytica]MCM2679480.1 MATE family efflux transporter [Echinimonas agarilytica]